MSQSLAGQVFETIRREILTCVLQPGQQIIQQQLAERYNVGITPVREALQKLTREGLIQPIPRFGFIVAPITAADVAEIFELRAILEVAAVRLAANRATPAQLERLTELAYIDDIYQDRERFSAFLHRNREFHLEIAGVGGNQRLVNTLAQVLDELTRVFYLGSDLRDCCETMRHEHENLVAALKEKNQEKAEQITLSQIDRSRQRIFVTLKSMGHRMDPTIFASALPLAPLVSQV